MSVLFLTEADVRRLLTMDLAIELVEDGFRRLAFGESMNVSRCRARTSEVILHLMSAASVAYGLVGFKAYTTSHGGARFHVVLYDGSTGEMVALIEADWLGQVRTGAASGVATRYMARDDATTIGIFGSGKQARTQLEAICSVRSITRATVWSPNPKRREVFAHEMERQCGVPVIPAQEPAEAAQGMDIIALATSSRKPVLDSRWIDEGTHINAIGSNALERAEVDVATIARCSKIVADSVEQCLIEAGDFVNALEEKILNWDSVCELADVVTGKCKGRCRSGEITLFESLGLAIEDLVVAAQLVQRARDSAVGTDLPI